MRREGGFTLLEVLVALAIFALVAASVLSASSRSLQTAARLQDKTLAMWVADNRLSTLQLSLDPVAGGREQGEEQMAGRRWQWQSEVTATSEPGMRRVTLWVAPYSNERGNLSERAVVTLSGFIGEMQ
ncbi:type II secretion system minor pseudopilin GspI [Pseudomonas sp. 5P_3.1_Bac2]|uniref:type II secretion system minor pseudopilin GspI n=1 Tax=Pseudomonas sp. 5P_3.1_Bac2 TaxID=2971617 RepID=UPI0021C6569D|nr:type II secretion system minor pseudopilin GspI [Pseudomonas sp. 5P_3.1_Bac2]MCU1716027.1 type II secretion system minor pseudopilin GspI [Pseudomonas sp. 5P_3.1_Bac2]